MTVIDMKTRKVKEEPKTIKQINPLAWADQKAIAEKAQTMTSPNEDRIAREARVEQYVQKVVQMTTQMGFNAMSRTTWNMVQRQLDVRGFFNET